MTAYQVRLDGAEMFEMVANWGDAASPITCDGKPTPFQVADFSDPEDAAEGLILWSFREGANLGLLDGWEDLIEVFPAGDW